MVFNIATPVFDGAKEDDVTKMLELATYLSQAKHIYGMEELEKNLIDQ